MRDYKGKWLHMKMASYGEVVNWVYFASQSLNSNMISKSFFLTVPRDVHRFNHRLKEILGEDNRQFMFKENIDWDRDDELLKQMLEKDSEVEILSFNEDLNLIYEFKLCYLDFITAFF